MIISSLTLENFRVFKGKHRIDLETKKDLPIVLFGGLNGAGKTTILTAVKLVLFGKASLKGSITSTIYNNYLEDQINKGAGDLNSASVSIEFDYSKLGKHYRYLIERSWSINNNKLKESLLIHENDKALSELNLSQAQSFIFDLIPLGVADLFFFDGEKMGMVMFLGSLALYLVYETSLWNLSWSLYAVVLGRSGPAAVLSLLAIPTV